MKEKISFSRFNSELNTDVCDPYNNAELTLTMRIGFRRIEPANGAAQGGYHDYGDVAAPQRKIVRWSGDAWTRWKDRFVQSAESFWHGKFWLLNDSGSFDFKTRTGLTLYPNVWCRFKLEAVDAPAPGLHHTIDVVRLHATESWFGSHATLYDSKDTALVQKATTSKNKRVMQRAHVHEVGHLLGLDHVDVGKPHCPASNTNASACYGVADADLISVMGSGMTLRPENAYPWRESMRQFTAQAVALRWLQVPTLAALGATLLMPVTNHLAVWPAATKRHYPRTQAEVAAGQAITMRPARAH